MFAGHFTILRWEVKDWYYTIAGRRLKLSMESHEYLRTETAVLRRHICLCCKEAEPLNPTSHVLYVQIATFQLKKTAVLCTWESSSPHQLPQGCPAPDFHQLWRLMSPCSCVMETEAMRRNQLPSFRATSTCPCISHPSRLPALAHLPILTAYVLIPHQWGCITSWQPLSIQPQL